MTRTKWRPSLGLLVTAVLLIVLSMPLLGLLFFQIYGNQLVRQTEESLIAQSRMLAAAYAQDLPAGATVGEAVSADRIAALQAPIIPALDLVAGPILPQPDEARPGAPADATHLELGRKMGALAAETQATTLAGFRILDPAGVVIGGGGDLGLSLAHIPEVAAALEGRFVSVLRLRSLNRTPPPLYSIARGTQVRVFVAMPVIRAGHVVGVIYASRTPNNVPKAMYELRWKLLFASLALLTATGLIGYLFWRGVTRPIQELVLRAQKLGEGDRTAMVPLKRHGTAEIARLSQSFLNMAQALFRRTDHMRTFAAHVTHELKSPLTAIRGAAELLKEDDGNMRPEQKAQFLDNILAETGRMTRLVARLRELAEAESPDQGGNAVLQAVVSGIAPRFPGLQLDLSGQSDLRLPLSAENLAICLAHLLENAGRSGSHRVGINGSIQGEAAIIEITDDGAGISENNRDRVFDPFFTTNRETGGTGMGLGIVRAMIEAHGGTIALAQSDSGARFVIRLPLAQ